VINFAPAATQSPTELALAQAQTALAQATAAITQAEQALRGGAGGFGGRGGGGAAAGGRGGAAGAGADFTTVQTVDAKVMPQFSGDETFFEAIFGGAAKFAEIKAKAEKGEPISAASLAGKISISIDNNYEVISEQLSHNVVGMIEGSDPKLKDTYVMFGAISITSVTAKPEPPVPATLPPAAGAVPKRRQPWLPQARLSNASLPRPEQQEPEREGVVVAEGVAAQRR